MKVGLDIHGVINVNTKFFAKFSKAVIDAGGEIHILTGPKFDKVESILKEGNIQYTHFFSIVEEIEKSGEIKIRWDEKGDPWADSEMWDRAKSEYARKHNLDIHIDDSEKYSKYFTTPFVLYKHKPKA